MTALSDGQVSVCETIDVLTDLWNSVFTSKMFIFAIGVDRKPITVHAEAIAKQSKALHALINGDMAEAHSCRVDLDDVDEDTFIRFCQFAYTGEYETPAFTHVSAPNDFTPTEMIIPILERSFASTNASSSGVPRSRSFSRSLSRPQSDVNEDPAAREPAIPSVPTPPIDAGRVGPSNAAEAEDWFDKSKRSTKRPSKDRILRREFDERDYDTSTLKAILQDRCSVRMNQNPEEDYTPVFLSHARLYVFAEKWGIEALKTLTLHKLHRTLTTFSLYDARRGDVIELAKYAYSSENTPDMENNVDDLRDLMVHFIACNLESFMEAPEWLSLLDQSGLFSRDVIRYAVKRFEGGFDIQG
jgi:hypothetical protein